mmetsp:Transcript_13658/g.29337  ORF Transcript_13658/g.29337 Transcript_13658/m.29337 type:complete len:276 (-) Transcript_13658:1652-2479(-)
MVYKFVNVDIVVVGGIPCRPRYYSHYFVGICDIENVHQKLFPKLITEFLRPKKAPITICPSQYTWVFLPRQPLKKFLFCFSLVSLWENLFRDHMICLLVFMLHGPLKFVILRTQRQNILLKPQIREQAVGIKLLFLQREIFDHWVRCFQKFGTVTAAVRKVKGPTERNGRFREAVVEVAESLFHRHVAFDTIIQDKRKHPSWSTAITQKGDIVLFDVTNGGVQQHEVLPVRMLLSFNVFVNGSHGFQPINHLIVWAKEFLQNESVVLLQKRFVQF